jgi:transcriptional regulator with XRE-family HTH domain
MRIRSVEEVATGTDEVISEELARRRRRMGVSQQAAALAIGVAPGELALVESGAIAAFAEPDRLRTVLLAYCGYLDLDPGPLMARLEAYSGVQVMDVETGPAAITRAPARRLPRVRWGWVVAGFLLLFVAGWLVLHAAPLG